MDGGEATGDGGAMRALQGRRRPSTYLGIEGSDWSEGSPRSKQRGPLGERSNWDA